MKKKFVAIVMVFIIIFLLLFVYVNNKNLQHCNQKKLKEEKINSKIDTIKKHYSEYVITNKLSKLYKLNDDFTEVGEINKDIVIKLDPIEIDENTKYFYVSDLDLYIPYDAVNPTEKKVKTYRYLNYIPFNENIITSNKTTFYDENDNYYYTINNSFDFSVIVKDKEKYGVIYNNELLYVNSSDVAEVYDNRNTDDVSKNKIRVLTYHAIYNPEIDECNTSICETLEQFESHLKYIRENDYFTLTLPELEMYLDGKINIPEKSIVLTIDDGTLLDLDAIKLLENYEVNATLFVITSWVDITNLKSDYLDLESHTHNMHNQYECPGYGMQGGGILCLPEEQVLNDLKTSQEILGGSKYFAYPFFDFNSRAIELLKKAGFHMAFIGQYDTDGYSFPKETDKFKVRRKTIFNDITMDEFISYLQ